MQCPCSAIHLSITLFDPGRLSTRSTIHQVDYPPGRQSTRSTIHQVDNPIVATAVAVALLVTAKHRSIRRDMGRSGKREVFIFRISSCDEGSQTLTPQTRIIVAVGQRVIEAAVPEPVTPEPGNLRVSFFSGRAMKSSTLARSCTLHPQLRRTSRALRSGLVLLGSKNVRSLLTSGRSIPLSSTCSCGEGETPQTSSRSSTAILPNDSPSDASACFPSTSEAPMAFSTRI